ncbi:MAG: flavin reductase family protein [Desulfurococcales archaeon]|nr:flavin reductase family protein [Desulfurococcales archaeon]
MAYKRVSDRELRLLRPLPVFLLFTGSMIEGDLDVMTLSWVTPLSKRQRNMGVVVEKGNYSWSLLKKYPWFTIAIPDSSQADLVKYVGTRTGREVDKILVTGINLSPWEGDENIPFPHGFMGVLVARVIREVDFDASTMFVGHVEGAYADIDAYDDERGWVIEERKPVLHLAKHFFTFPCERVSVVNTRWGIGVKKPWRELFKS